MPRLAITPLELTVMAPLRIVLEVFTIVHGVEHDTGLATRATVQVTPTPPDVVTLVHVGGRFAGAVEHIRLDAAQGGTRVTASADFEPSDDESPRAQLYMLEASILATLEDMRTSAESMARLQSFPPQAAPNDGEAAPAASEEQLLRLVDDQELTEWGHIGHGRGVARVAVFLAGAMALGGAVQRDAERAALLHDAGKLALDSRLWGRLGTLSVDERALMRAHAVRGADLVAAAGLPVSVKEAILHHHERWDGTGYPAGLAGDSVPVLGRILWLAENVDSMMRASYRRVSLPLGSMLKILEAGSGVDWDPDLVSRVAPLLRDR